MTCKCYYCETHRKLSEAKRNKNTDELFRIASELGGKAISAEFDLDYYLCILDGSWETSVEILEKALKKAKDYKRSGK